MCSPTLRCVSVDYTCFGYFLEALLGKISTLKRDGLEKATEDSKITTNDETATATEKSAIVNGYFFRHYKMSACFIKWAARDKRSPTSLNCGQIVEDKTTENKKVIPLRSC